MRKFLLVGRTGVGKSSFINAAFGSYIAETSEYEACTKIVEHYAYKTPLGDVSLIDTPGLAEDDEACDEAYLSLVRAKVNLAQIYATIYVSRLNETRFRPDEKRTLRLLTNRLGASIWNRSILVLTFAASIPNHQLEIVAEKRSQQIFEFIQNLTKEQDIGKIFQGFEQTWLVDNIVENWTSDGLPILSVLTN
ncbi:50S ribosome-binding GTPase [Microcoleus sp. herbarium19]|uniref:GTPase n=1 Tax=unclassified Microcoleus TaxID=2642155 RepID=UPI002FD23C36